MIDADAKQIHARLNQMIVGNVLIVEVATNATLETKAKMYSHHHCLPNSNPGKMMTIFVANEIASTVLTLVQ